MSDEDNLSPCSSVANIYYDGEHYDQRYKTYDHDVEFYAGLAREHGPKVLELAEDGVFALDFITPRTCWEYSV